MVYSIIVIGVFALFSAAFAQKRAIKRGRNPTLWAAISAITDVIFYNLWLAFDLYDGLNPSCSKNLAIDYNIGLF